MTPSPPSPSPPSPSPPPPSPPPPSPPSLWSSRVSVLDLAPVLPVVVVDDPADAVPLARALVAGGLPAIEVTLRTPGALDAVRAVSAEVPGAVVGVGTVITPPQVAESVAAGGRFLVSPGWTDMLLAAMRTSGVPFLPGVSTASEVVALLERGVREMKFFPAEAAGGTTYLKSLAGPLPQARFCPTGGVGPGNAPEYLALPNVGCVGGTWMLPSDAVAARDWARIERLAREAAGLGDRRSAQV
ncbi:bifunctional 4-hydroxy-2-oxoglutarate aldolase/2-dehydro-3-deoxy-phosphogluconate aldolase [Streptomyces caniscabiei]|uniref:bifunctional 4-hydroxy-2-oxoglutarate aldolase/2-dehydro-3-deoxy-phosphogluconate aldolase n=1 Tax=Streptomyces caniscabiei TaxID=2746961 RepID=UPI001CE1D991|nr:bifunctional 4-hydroxy-2-oxoglutarate aldolase/2-dehydro-3-deoxy-phosphogluconate aldolase [Streptomyces caniscabiei]MDX3732811.1 bifunctional 4-hydroxy-2-oxoglutarate aldolase/2-dehydro-3-deoxy-phosphogluconate aldolase [Streptomyces caniscabiei]